MTDAEAQLIALRHYRSLWYGSVWFPRLPGPAVLRLDFDCWCGAATKLVLDTFNVNVDASAPGTVPGTLAANIAAASANAWTALVNGPEVTVTFNASGTGHSAGLGDESIRARFHDGTVAGLPLWQTEYNAVSAGTFKESIIIRQSFEGTVNEAAKKFEQTNRLAALQKYRGEHDREYAKQVFAPDAPDTTGPTVTYPVFSNGAFFH